MTKHLIIWEIWQGIHKGIQLEFYLPDLWIGAYWRTDPCNRQGTQRQCSIWIALIPCLPVRIWWIYNAKPGKEAQPTPEPDRNPESFEKFKQHAFKAMAKSLGIPDKLLERSVPVLDPNAISHSPEVRARVKQQRRLAKRYGLGPAAFDPIKKQDDAAGGPANDAPPPVTLTNLAKAFEGLPSRSPVAIVTLKSVTDAMSLAPSDSICHCLAIPVFAVETAAQCHSAREKLQEDGYEVHLFLPESVVDTKGVENA